MDMTTPERTRGVSGTLAGIVAALGGAIVAVGTFLVFATVEAFGISQSVIGMDTESDWYYLGSGLALVVLGLVIVSVRSTVARRVVGALGVLVAGLATVVSIMDIAGLEDEIPADVIDQVTVSPGIGLYLAVAGAVIGLTGSALALFARGEEPAPIPPAPPPPPPEPTERGI